MRCVSLVRLAVSARGMSACRGAGAYSKQTDRNRWPRYTARRRCGYSCSQDFTTPGWGETEAEAEAPVRREAVVDNRSHLVSHFYLPACLPAYECSQAAGSLAADSAELEYRPEAYEYI